MKLSNYASAGVVVALAFASSLTHAGDDVAIQEKAAIARLSLANIVSEQDGRYIHARGLAVDGGTSVDARVKAWLMSEQAWTLGWTRILAVADCNADIPFAQFMAQLAQMLDDQSKALVQLTDESAAVAKLANDALAVMGRAEAIPSGPEAQPYAAVIASLAARQTELRAMLNQIAVLPGQKLARLADVDALSRRGILAHMKSALVARAKYPLQQALADVAALLSSEQIIDPRLTRIQNAFTAMNGYSAGLAYFHAVDAIGPARALCADTRAQLTKLTQPAKYVADSLGAANNMCDGIEQLYAGVTGDTSVAPSDYVSAYLSGEKTRLAPVCGAASTRPACQKLSLIASLTDADLAKMSAAELHLVEIGWSESMARALETTPILRAP